jgi:hypothetical protein
MIGMGAKSFTIVRAVTADFFFDCRAAEVLSMSELGTYHGTSTMMRKTLDWNRYRISMLSEVFAAKSMQTFIKVTNSSGK